MTIARLVFALLRFVWEESLRSRMRYVAVTFLAISSAQVTLAAAASARACGPIFIIGLWALSLPLCRPWVEADARQGYAAFWLQKPVAPSVFYLARLMAVIVWSMAVTLAVLIATLPATILPTLRAVDLAELALGTGWMPPLLIVMSFLGSAIGAGNAALFAFALLLGGLAFPGLSDVVGLGRLEEVVQLVLPPATTGLDAMRTLRETGIVAAALRLWPLVAYGVACAALGLLAARRMPARLGRAR
jgi:hypothetical protein